MRAHGVPPVALRAVRVRNTHPPVVPASTSWSTALSSVWPARGATAIALTEPHPRGALAAVQDPAALVVRHMRSPPVHRICELFGDITKGTMKRNPESTIP